MASTLRKIANPALRAVLDESQQKFTAERLAGMSKGEIQHIFEDIDKDGSGGITFDEFDFLEPYFGTILLHEILKPCLLFCWPKASQRGFEYKSVLFHTNLHMISLIWFHYGRREMGRGDEDEALQGS